MTRVRALFDRPPFNSPWIRRMVSGTAAVVVRHRVRSRDRSGDAGPAPPSSMRAYLEATRVWLAGGDPGRPDRGQLLRGAPPTLLAFAPFTLLPADTAVALIALAVIGGAVARSLAAPAVVVAAVPAPGPMRPVRHVRVSHRAVDLVPAGGLAVILKIYAGLPRDPGHWRSLSRRPRSCWRPPILRGRPNRRFAPISQRLADQSKLTLPMGFLLLVSPLVLLSLLVVGRELPPARRPGVCRRSSSSTGPSRCRSQEQDACLDLFRCRVRPARPGAFALVSWGHGDRGLLGSTASADDSRFEERAMLDSEGVT